MFSIIKHHFRFFKNRALWWNPVSRLFFFDNLFSLQNNLLNQLDSPLFIKIKFDVYHLLECVVNWLLINMPRNNFAWFWPCWRRRITLFIWLWNFVKYLVISYFWKFSTQNTSSFASFNWSWRIEFNNSCVLVKMFNALSLIRIILWLTKMLTLTSFIIDLCTINKIK